MRNKLGFSLVELLIVLAIIGILGAIGIPSYTRYVARSKRMECTAFLASINMGEWAYIDGNDYSINYAFCTSSLIADPAIEMTTDISKPILPIPSTERDKYCDISSTKDFTIDGKHVTIAPPKLAEVYYQYSILAMRVGAFAGDFVSSDIQGGPLFPPRIVSPDDPTWKTGDVSWTNVQIEAVKQRTDGVKHSILVKPVLKDQFMVACIGQLDDDDTDDIVIQDHIRRTFIFSDDIKK